MRENHSFKEVQEIAREVFSQHKQFLIAKQLLAEAHEQLVVLDPVTISSQEDFDTYWNDRKTFLEQERECQSKINMAVQKMKKLYGKAVDAGWASNMTITFPLNENSDPDKDLVQVSYRSRNNSDARLFWEINIYDEGTNVRGSIYHIADGDVTNEELNKMGIWKPDRIY